MQDMGRFSKLRAPAIGWPVASAPRPAPPSAGPGGLSFRDRARLRRRLGYLRRTRELAFRDLGGFVFESRRLGRRREDIVEAKLKGLAAIDAELRVLAAALDERHELTVLREPGITVCQACGAIHGSDAGFCPGCGAAAGAPRRPTEWPPPRASAAEQPTAALPAVSGGPE